MGDPEVLRGLAERVERLAGPDREVDFAIAEAVSPDPSHWHGARKRRADPYNALWYTPGQDSIPERGWEWGQRNYTASLDHAMSLVPEGMRFYVDNGTGDGGDSHACAFLDSNLAISGGCKFAATPALALTAAALRARAQAMDPSL